MHALGNPHCCPHTFTSSATCSPSCPRCHGIAAEDHGSPEVSSPAASAGAEAPWGSRLGMSGSRSAEAARRQFELFAAHVHAKMVENHSLLTGGSSNSSNTC